MSRFITGQIIRYGTGTHSLMRVDNIMYNHVVDGYNHYYGVNFFNQPVSFSERHCTEASQEDINSFKLQRGTKESLSG